MRRAPEKKPYLKLFTSVLTLSAMTFGGGYVIVPLLKRRFTETLGWFEENEMLELAAIGQACPGAISINTAALVGYRAAGLPGALLAVLGAVLPPLIILSLLYPVYSAVSGNAYVGAALRAMRAAIAAVIADVVITMAKPYFSRDKLPSLSVMLAAFAAAWFFRVNAALIIAACAVFGALCGLLRPKRGRGEK
jgi:chromate transporter